MCIIKAFSNKPVFSLLSLHRCSVVTVKDISTKELTLSLRENLHKIFNEYPFTVINELHRRKLDPNREIGQAAFGVKEAEDAWNKVKLL